MRLNMPKMLKLDPEHAVPGWQIVLPSGKTVIVEGRLDSEVMYTSCPVPQLQLRERVVTRTNQDGTPAHWKVVIRATFAIGPGMHWAYYDDLRTATAAW